MVLISRKWHATTSLCPAAMRVAALVLTAAVMHLCGTPSHAGVGDDIICGGGAATAGGSQQQATSRLAQLAAHLTTPAPEPTARRAAEVAAAAPERPHILLVVADDLGWNDVGSWNGPGLPTAYAPVLDELMATGVKLKQHYSEAICSPTRGALMSGRYPHRWGGQSAVAIQNTENYFPLDEVTLATRLKEVGCEFHWQGLRPTMPRIRPHQNHPHRLLLPPLRPMKRIVP